MKEKCYFQYQAGRRRKQPKKDENSADSFVAGLSPILRPNPPTTSQRRDCGKSEQD